MKTDDLKANTQVHRTKKNMVNKQAVVHWVKLCYMDLNGTGKILRQTRLIMTNT